MSEKPKELKISSLNIKIAKAAHALIYVITLGVLFSGILMMDHPIHIYGSLSIQNPINDAQWNSLFSTMHKGYCAILAVLVATHILAVVKHQFSGINVLARMS